jgi:hypothetical protein
VPKDFIQITATSVAAQRGNGQASPHVAAIQITTDNTVFGAWGGPASTPSASRGESKRLRAGASWCLPT